MKAIGEVLWFSADFLDLGGLLLCDLEDSDRIKLHRSTFLVSGESSLRFPGVFDCWQLVRVRVCVRDVEVGDACML